MGCHTKRLKDGRTVFYAVYKGPDGVRRKERFRVEPADAERVDRTRARDAARSYANAQAVKVENGEWHGTKKDLKKDLDAARESGTLPKALAAFVKSRGGGPHWFYHALPFGRFFEEQRKQVKTLADVTRTDAEAYRANRGKSVSASTLRKDLIFARALFQWAREEKTIPLDLDPFKSVKMPREPKALQHYLSVEQETALRDACAGMPWLDRVVAWLIDTGMDRAEVCSLRWRDVKRADGIVCVPEYKTRERRTIMLNPDLVRVLAECEKVRHISDRVFLDDEGQPIKPKRITPTLIRAYERAGMRSPRGGPVKILRHTFATRLVLAGVSIVVVQRMLGHNKIETTMRYVTVGDGEQRDAVDALHRRRAAVSAA